MISAILGTVSGSSSTFRSSAAAARSVRPGGRIFAAKPASLSAGNGLGGYAERLAVPERCLLPLPDDVPNRLAPLLLDTIGTTAHGIRLARRIVEPGTALVLGAGPIGLGAIIVLARIGFGPIHVVEPVSYRAAFATSLGAVETSA